MHLDTSKFALAAAATFGAMYIVCALFVALWPDIASTLMSWLTHIVNLEPRRVTWVGFFGGLAQVLVYTYIGAFIFAWLHNKFVTVRR